MGAAMGALSALGQSGLSMSGGDSEAQSGRLTLGGITFAGAPVAAGGNNSNSLLTLIAVGALVYLVVRN